jgi:hypothetical protein
VVNFGWKSLDFYRIFDKNGRHLGFSLFRSRLCIKFGWNITGKWLDSASIFVSIRPDSNVNLPRPTYIHSNSQGFSSELLLFLLGAQGGGSTCPGQARVQRVKVRNVKSIPIFSRETQNVWCTCKQCTRRGSEKYKTGQWKGTLAFNLAPILKP